MKKDKTPKKSNNDGNKLNVIKKKKQIDTHVETDSDNNDSNNSSKSPPHKKRKSIKEHYPIDYEIADDGIIFVCPSCDFKGKYELLKEHDLCMAIDEDHLKNMYQCFTCQRCVIHPQCMFLYVIYSILNMLYVILNKYKRK